MIITYSLTGKVLEAYDEDVWAEFPGEDFSRWNWRQQIASQSTQLGYWEWLQHQVDVQANEELHTLNKIG